MERYGNGALDLEFRQIAITAAVRSGRLTTHDANTRDVNFARYREECLREGIEPHTAVEVEALRGCCGSASARRSRAWSTTSGSGTSNSEWRAPSGSCYANCKAR
ncbi:hypothetical protein AB0G32_13610 [Streptomyces sp. NPDC023723]|uniref:hypothetical protein n=1 Tax=Streptomyces sp. NPDC023723 TaxID=3154323 RepID=UPI0033E0CE07